MSISASPHSETYSSTLKFVGRTPFENVLVSGLLSIQPADCKYIQAIVSLIPSLPHNTRNNRNPTFPDRHYPIPGSAKLLRHAICATQYSKQSKPHSSRRASIFHGCCKDLTALFQITVMDDVLEGDVCAGTRKLHARKLHTCKPSRAVLNLQFVQEAGAVTA